MRILKIALYARVSTLLNQDPELQLVQLREFAKARGLEVVAEFTDRGISGAKESRPALDEMLRQARLGKFHSVGITALDRLGRNTRHTLTLIENFKTWKIALISIRENIETDSPQGLLMLTIFSAISALERSLISERIKNALAAKKEIAAKTGNGWRCGRTPLSDEIIEKVKSLRQQGLSLRTISQQLNIGKTSCERILRGKR